MKAAVFVVFVVMGLSVVVGKSGPPKPPAGTFWKPVGKLTDEFNHFNDDKWQKGHPYWEGRFPSRIVANGVSFAKGKMKLTMRLRDPKRNGRWLDAPCLTSDEQSFLPGMYSEARIRMADISLVSSWWMQGKTTEIDVLENFGHIRRDKQKKWGHLAYLMGMNTHYNPDGFGKKTDRQISTPLHFKNPDGKKNSADYAVYGVWWKSTREIRFFRNGKPAGTVETSAPFNEPMYMFFDMEPFTWGPGVPENDVFRNYYKSTASYDWVRTYKLHVPVKWIKAVKYSKMHGVQTQVSKDFNGGEMVGGINQNDWAEYAVTNPLAGKYEVSFRVASAAAGAKLVLLNNYKPVVRVNIPKTGGWQTWRTVTTTAFLPWGPLKLRVKSTAAAGWNFNWMKLVKLE